MKILALEFSSEKRSVAVFNDGAVFESVETAVRDTKALGLVERTLSAAKLEREEIEVLAIGLGPGSYHGIRAAIALAQGWQLANEIKLLGISSAEAVAAQAQAEGFVGMAGVVIDAQRNEFYYARYEVTATSHRELEPLRIVSLPGLNERASADAVSMGPEIHRWFPTGRIVFPTAAIVTRLASRRADFVAGEKLEPIYLRETAFVKAPPLRMIT